MSKTGKQTFIYREIQRLLGDDSHHLWRSVRRAGIKPQKQNGVYVLTHEQLEQFKRYRQTGEKVNQQEMVKPEQRVSTAGQAFVFIPAVHHVPEPWVWGE